ncbi:MAG: lytic murein transglycosylase [Ideonella sp.]|nr:lytic murein transglycosylase [Ideonella sp.]
MTPGRHRVRRAVTLGGIAFALAAASGCADARKRQARAAARPASTAHAASAPEAPGYAKREDVARFADLVAERHALDAAWVRSTLAAARYQATVARLIMPPPAGTAKNWAAYRARFVEPRRIGAGVAFWRANARWLAQAESEYGVPAEIVAGIIGVETIYGQQMGSFRAIDALATLAFDFPAGRKDRSDFFRDELAHLFVMCRGAAPRETDGPPQVSSTPPAGGPDEARTRGPAARPACDPLDLRSSYAGALGMPQFMPSSVNRYAIDFDGDGRIALHDSAADVIGSVAHYLAEFGWQRGMPTHYAVAAPVDTVQRATLLVPDILPSFSARQMIELGAELDAAGRDHEGLLALVELQNGNAAPSYVAGTANFYAITRYNWSSYYALAVIELGQAVKRRIEEAGGPPRPPPLGERPSEE